MNTILEELAELESMFGCDDLSFIDAVYVWVYKDIDYSGNAFLLYRDKNDNLLYEVYGSHCSCYGLEGQFKPVRASTARLSLWLASIEESQYTDDFDIEVVKQLGEVINHLEDQSGL